MIKDVTLRILSEKINDLEHIKALADHALKLDAAAVDAKHFAGLKYKPQVKKKAFHAGGETQALKQALVIFGRKISRIYLTEIKEYRI